MRNFNFEGETAARLIAQLQATAQQSHTFTHADQAIVSLLDKSCQVEYEADSTKEALRLAGQHPIQLALVDVVLGHDTENAIRCARRLRALDPQMRMVLISAYPDREFHRQGVEAGAVAFLDKKDLDVSTLQQVVEDVISTEVGEKASVSES